LTEGGRLLGILPTERYNTGTVELAPGSLLTLFSDGITDATNANGERFCEQRVIELLRAMPSAPAQVILTSLLEAVECFAGATERVDDISLLVVSR
jgi:sigma-B regulation protein RsbU (phosphoserine phosphatase)